MKQYYHLFVSICFFINCISTMAQQARKHSLHKTSSPEQCFTVYGSKVKYNVYNTDTVRLDSGTFVIHTAEYVWDTINAGYIFIVKEVRLFCDSIKPEVMENDIKNIISVIPKNGFKLLDKRGGEFSVDIEEALYDGGEDSVFISDYISGFIGGSAGFEESGVVGLRYLDLKKYNDSLYKRPDIYPMNRFGKQLQLR